MSTTTKDFDDVIKEVLQLRTGFWGQLAFAATCSERLLPFYRCYVEEKNELNDDPYVSALISVWHCVETMERYENVRDLLEECEAKLPAEEDAWKVGCPYAGDGAAVILYSLRFLFSKDQQEVIWAARRAYEVADNFVCNLQEQCLGSPNGENSILRHPIIQNELTRQLRDLRELECTANDTQEFLAVCINLKRRASEESINFLKVSS